jgi:hypothetical protein
MKQSIILFIAFILALSAYGQENSLDGADKCFNKGDYTCSEAKYREVFKTAVGKAKQIIEIKIERAKKCNMLLQSAEKEFNNKNYTTAKENYLAILDSNPNDDYVKSQLKIIKDLLDKPKNIIFSLSKTELSFEASGGSINVAVALNLGSYQIDLLPSWCSVQKYDKYFVVYCNKNNTNTQRNNYFNAIAGNQIIRVNILQQGLYQTEEQKKAEELQKIQIAKRRLVVERKKILEPYLKVVSISDNELATLSEPEFNNKLVSAKAALKTEELRVERLNRLTPFIGEATEDEILKLGTYTDSDFEIIYSKAKDKNLEIKNLEIQRRLRIEPYISFVGNLELSRLGKYNQNEFELIYTKAKKDFKNQKKINRNNISSFSSLGFQSGEIAKYGFIYETGGNNLIGFHLSARSSLIPEEDILTRKSLENKTELHLGPNFKIGKRVYFNIALGYGYYNKLVRNDYAGTLAIEKIGYYAASTGLMFRINSTININGGASFIDIDKDFYKPEITFGISFNLKRR